MDVRVLKIGGSVVARAGQYFAYDQANVRALGDALRTFPGPVVVAHGLGNFGRAYVPCYIDGALPASEALLARRIQRQLTELHDLVVTDLREAGVPVRGFAAESLFALHDGRIVAAALDLVEHYLRSGAVPVLYGGTVWDDGGRFTILSSDLIVAHLAGALQATRMVWATDVDGVLDEAQHQVIDQLSEANLERMWRQDYDRTDATGGMTSKVNVALGLARRGCTSVFVNGFHPDRVVAALSAEPVPGTVIHAR